MQHRHIFVKLDQEQIINFKLNIQAEELDMVVILAPDELPSTTLHKRVIANKNINNSEKLSSYGYELYNKIQVDVNNIGDKFINGGMAQRLDVVMNYLDSTDNGKTFLPVLLSENISQFYFQEQP